MDKKLVDLYMQKQVLNKENKILNGHLSKCDEDRRNMLKNMIESNDKSISEILVRITEIERNQF